jgi:septum formation protein
MAARAGAGGARADGAGPPIVLASGSPQRREILTRLGVRFTVRVPDVEELTAGDPAHVTLENARRKARAVLRPGADETIIACDTVVALGGAIYGKPSDEREALRTLSALAGRTHEVVSGLVVLVPGESPRNELDDLEERTAVARTEVTFAPADERRLAWYLATGEWRERAGGYAIQGAGAALVRSVSGEYENVVGLPVARLLELYPALLP